MKHPLLYQINTRVFLQERGVALGRPATLEDIPDTFLDDVAAKGFAWVWFLGVWQTGPVGRQISLSNPKLVEECRRDLPDLRDQDVSGSPFAITAYRVHDDFGGDAALARLRTRLTRRGLKLLLDFVPNHTARDHQWVTSHPEYYVHGSEADIAGAPQNYARVEPARRGGPAPILAFGRDPYFDGWPDTFQLNYRHGGFREAQIAELGAIANRCDGVRCDMAMLLQPQIIQRTWGDRALPADGSPPKDAAFWPEAFAANRRRHPQLRQAPLRPADRRRGDASARAPECGRRVPGSFAAFPGEPRRATGRGGVSAGDAQGRGGGGADGARAALHPRG
jgi:hypothetical protein